ncbi:condensation domain-containing protein, partial [Pseudomonas syringae]|uniref:condensation domain-containing protein n=1 Tax=Pseudomonas syringae TaxID=317 RepID=UPI0011D15BF8
NDDQVKIRGVRIELGEIENQFSQLPGIEEALVLAREDEPGQPRLVGYFTERAGAASSTVEQLRTALLARLPGYMVPGALVRLESWPLTANGKVDRRALPVPDRTALSTGEYQAPQGDLESALALIWSELLQVERIGRHDRFFELGGHSLLAMRMVSQVRQRLALELALGDLFADSSLIAVAHCLSAAARSQLPAIDVQPRNGPLPLSSAQQRIWFMAQMEDANSAYNISLGLKLSGPLDSRALTRALERIVARHDSLRSRFSQEDDNAWVEAAPVTEVPRICWQDLRDQDPQALQAVIREEAAQPFDLQHDLPIRGRLLCLAEDRHVLLLTVHHIVADGWSLGVLTRELTALYQAFSQGQEDPLPALALQYGDYAVWQRNWLDDERLSHQADYWQQTLTGAPVLLTLPTDRPRPAHQDYTGASVALDLDPRLSTDLRAFCQAQSVTPFMLFMGAWAVLLARLSGQEEVVVGMPVANRRRAEIEGLIGLFVNTLAVRVDTSGEPDVVTLLERIKARVVEAQDHQDLPFEQVVERLRPPRSLAHSPLFQASLTWDGSQGLELQLGDMQLEPLDEQAAFAKFDLALSVSDGPDHFRCIVEYATALFDHGTIERHLNYLEAILRAMVADSQTVVSHIPLLSEAERRQLTDGFNAPDAVYPQEQTLHSQFEAQAQRTPDAIAVSYEEESWSYATLNAQANRIAHRLIDMGIGADDRVAICTHRGLQMIAGLLGILKAGAAYVPLDPAYPVERLAYTLDDSAPVALLSQRSVQGTLPVSQVPVICLDDDLQDESVCNPQVPVTPGNLAYVIYTSGSTGTPKGVMIEHRNVARLFSATEEWFGFNQQDVWALFHSFAFDFSVWEI